MAEAIRLVKRNTRHYAKRQMTWLRRYPDMLWFNLSAYPSETEALAAIFSAIRAKL
jgi:tRNA dimethylallyltransferase